MHAREGLFIRKAQKIRENKKMARVGARANVHKHLLRPRALPL